MPVAWMCVRPGLLRWLCTQNVGGGAMADIYNRVYVGRAMPEWKGRRCRVVTTWRRKGRHNVKVEFENGDETVCPIRCIRKVKGEPNA